MEPNTFVVIAGLIAGTIAGAIIIVTVCIWLCYTADPDQLRVRPDCSPWFLLHLFFMFGFFVLDKFFFSFKISILYRITRLSMRHFNNIIIFFFCWFNGIVTLFYIFKRLSMVSSFVAVVTLHHMITIILVELLIWCECLYSMEKLIVIINKKINMAIHCSNLNSRFSVTEIEKQDLVF